MDPTRYRNWLVEAGDGVLAAIGTGRLDAPVPSCPGWTLLDLVGHLGRVHRWAARTVRTRIEHGQDFGHGPDGEPAGWYRAARADLLDALDSTDPDTPCWSFGPPASAAFWWRRQALEATVHRIDAQQATGAVAPVDPPLAADGVAEVFEVMLPRRAALGFPVDLAAPVTVHCTDTGHRWSLRPAPGGGPPVLVTGDAPAGEPAEVRGTAHGLLCVLWKRAAPDAAGVVAHGDSARRFLAASLTP